MKYIFKVISILTVLVLLFSLSSCSFRFSSFDNLLRPPKLIGKYQGLQDSFESSIKDSFQLLIPENGEFQSSFITFDFDSDSNEEALVFYTLKDSPDIAKVSFFEYKDENWLYVSSFDGLGNTIDKVVIEDINKDGFFEVIIGWNLYSSKLNRAFVAYTVNGENMIQSFTHPYTHFDMVDVNGDGYSDLLSLYVDSSIPEQLKAVAGVYNFNALTSQFTLLGETYLDGNISSYSSIKSEIVDDDIQIYVESTKGQTESITEILIWDNEKKALSAPLFDLASQTTFATWRNINLTVLDVDHDNYYEIPTSVEMPGSVVTTSDILNNNTVTSDNRPASQIYFTKWTKFRNNKLKPVQYSVVNNELGYMLNIKSSWVGRITVLGNDGQWDYYRWDALNAQVGELLFSIYAYNNNDAEDKKQYSAYTQLKSTNTKTYVCQITKSGSKFGVSEDLLADNLVLTDFGGSK